MAETNANTTGSAIKKPRKETHGRMRFRLTISFRVIGLVVLVALLTGALVGYILIRTSIDSIGQTVLKRNLSQAELAAGFASKYIQAVEAHGRVFAQRPDIRQAILNHNESQIQSTLVQFVEIQTAINNAAAYDTNGIQTVSSTINNASLGQSFADREWFQQVISRQQPYLGIPVQSRVTGEVIVPYGIPVFDEQDQLQGILGVAISLKALSDTITDIEYGATTSALMIDTRGGGRIIADNDPQLLLTSLPEEKQALIGQLGAFETSSGGLEKELIGSAKTPNLPWLVIVSTPSQSAFAAVKALTQRTIIITAVVTILAVIGGIFLMMGVTRPIRRLMEGARQIERGNLEFQVATTGNDEIGDLSRALGKMAQSLSEKDLELRRYSTMLEGKVQERTAELSRSNANLSQFAYVASHDLQEPLRIVASYLQLIEQRYKDKLDEDGLEFMRFAKDGAARMGIMINDLLAFSRVGTKAKPFELTDCESMLNQALSNLGNAIQESQVLITHERLPSLMADSTQIVQLFQNLIANAIKFRSREQPLVHISVKEEGEFWLFAVRDNGIGIEAQYFERIFVIFQRLHLKEEYPGSGIGLAICKKIVEQHRGQIRVESEPGKGSTFYFTIPKGEAK